MDFDNCARQLALLLLFALLLLGSRSAAPAEEGVGGEAARIDAIVRQLAGGNLSKTELRALLREYNEYKQTAGAELTPEQKVAAEQAIAAAFANFIGRGEVPLVIAARDGDLETARAELAKGVDPDSQMGNETALMNASLQGYDEIVRMLLEAGADPAIGIQPTTRWTALQFAAMNGQLAALELLLAHEPGPPAEPLRDALFVAAQMGRPQTLKRIVGAGADANAAVPDGTTPLMLAARGDHGQTIGMLAQLGAEPNARDATGRTALMFAGWLGNAAAVAALVAAGADPEISDDRGGRAFPAGTAPADFAGIAARSHIHAAIRPDACPTIIGYTNLHRGESGLAAGAYGLYRRPAPGTDAWVALHEGAGAIPVRIRTSEPSEYPEGTWNAELEVSAEQGAALAGADRGLSALLLWPASEQPPNLLSPPSRDIPYGVFPESIELALDTDGDGHVDVLELGHCCKQPSQVDGCEYTCGSYWQKSAQGWVQCEFIQPE